MAVGEIREAGAEHRCTDVRRVLDDAFLMPHVEGGDCRGACERTTELPMTQTGFHHAVPVYQKLPGWKTDISGCSTFAELPKNAQAYVRFLEEQSGAPISAIGVGQDRNATFVVRDLID